MSGLLKKAAGVAGSAGVAASAAVRKAAAAVPIPGVPPKAAAAAAVETTDEAAAAPVAPYKMKEPAVAKCLQFSYGENTSLSVSVKEADFGVHALPGLGLALVETTLVVVNDAIGSTIEGKLRFPLPEDAKVVRYAFEVSPGKLVDAMALPNRKAAEVAYREREKGRNVSTTQQVEGNLFETTIFPLVPNVEQRLVITFMMKIDGPPQGPFNVRIPMRFPAPLRSSSTSVFAYPSDAFTVEGAKNVSNSALDDGVDVAVTPVSSKTEASVTFGKYLDTLHFSAFVPRAALTAALDAAGQKAKAVGKDGVRVHVVWDASQSCKPSTAEAQEKLEGLFASLEEAHKKGNRSVTFDLSTFATSVEAHGKDLSAAEAAKAVHSVVYDGGTNLACLSEIFLAKTNYDYTILVTDGVDNVSGGTRLPRGVDEQTAPVHVLTPPGAAVVNSTLLRCLATQTQGTFGVVSGEKANIIAGVVEELVITGVKPLVDDDDVWRELFLDESFCTVPDWKLLQKAWWPVQEQGGYVSGTVGSIQPSGLEVTVSSTVRGSAVVTVPFPEAEGGITSYEGEIGRLLGVFHCNQVITEARNIMVDPEFAKKFIEETALKYNIASEHTSLLLLHTAEQFADNEIDCPEDHPEYEKYMLMKASKESNAEIIRLNKEVERIQKLQTVVELASRMHQYGLQNLPAPVQAEIDLLVAQESAISTAQTLARNLIDAQHSAARELHDVVSSWDQLKRQDPQRTLQALQQVDDGKDLIARIVAVIEGAAAAEGEVNECRTALQTFDDYKSDIAKEHSTLLSELTEKKNVLVANKSRAELLSRHEKEKAKLRAELQHTQEDIARIQREERERAEKLRRMAQPKPAAKDKDAADDSSDASSEDESDPKPKMKDSKVKESKSKSRKKAKKKKERRAAVEEEVEEEKCAEMEMEAALCFDEEDDECESLAEMCLAPCAAPAPASAPPPPGPQCAPAPSRSCAPPAMGACAPPMMARSCSAGPPMASGPPRRAAAAARGGGGGGGGRGRGRGGGRGAAAGRDVSPRKKVAADYEDTVARAEKLLAAGLAALKGSAPGDCAQLSAAQEIVKTFPKKLAEAVDAAEPVKKSPPSQPTERKTMEEWATRAGKMKKAVLDGSSQPYLMPIHEALAKNDTAGAYKAYVEWRDKDNYSTSPSFYIYSARLFHSAECPRELTMRVISNTLEMNVQDVQMFRSVSYFMLEIGALDEAVELFRRVQDKAPAEPQSFIDLGLALFFRGRRSMAAKNEEDEEDGKRDVLAAVNEMAQAITGKWVSRFAEIEWPCILWLNWMCSFGTFAGFGDIWPTKQIARAFELPGLNMDVVVAMAWDTDNTDIDLHVYEPPPGSHCYYGSRDSTGGGHCSRDFTQGYGPEVYVNQRALPGIHRIAAKYYASSQVSGSTGTTSCVLWVVKNFGRFEQEEFYCQMVRLERNKDQIDVHMIEL